MHNGCLSKINKIQTLLASNSLLTLFSLHYSFDITGLILSLAAVYLLTFVFQTIFPLSIFLTGVLRPDMELFTVTIMVLCVSYIYGVQRLSDDIHFFLGSQPAKFWKVCWYSIPVLLMVHYFL